MILIITVIVIIDHGISDDGDGAEVLLEEYSRITIIITISRMGIVIS